MRKISVLGIKKIIRPRPLGGRAPGAPPLDPLVDTHVNLSLTNLSSLALMSSILVNL